MLQTRLCGVRTPINEEVHGAGDHYEDSQNPVHRRVTSDRDNRAQQDWSEANSDIHKQKECCGNRQPRRGSAGGSQGSSQGEVSRALSTALIGDHRLRYGHDGSRSNSVGGAQQAQLSDADLTGARQLVTEKYATEQWRKRIP